MTTQFDKIVSNKKRTFKFDDDITINRFNTDYVLANQEGEDDIDIIIDTTNVEPGHHWELFAFANTENPESTINIVTIGPNNQSVTFTMIISNNDSTSTTVLNIPMVQNSTIQDVSEYLASCAYGTITAIQPASGNVELRISLFLGSIGF